MRWIGLGHGFSQIRSFSSPPERDFRRVAALAKLWEKFIMRKDILSFDEQSKLRITRTDKPVEDYSRLRLKKGCSGVILHPADGDGKINEAKNYVKGHLRNALIRSVGLHDVKDEFLSSCKTVYFEVLKSLRDGNFSNLTEFTLGGNETLQFHRAISQKLTKTQKEILNITENDLLGDNGYLRKFPWLRGEMGPYIHSIDFLNVDAAGNPHLVDDQKHKMFMKYKVVIAGVYKFDVLLRELRGGSYMWNQKIKTPSDYGFRWPRYVFVELDICQVATPARPIQLDDTRYLYDFHVFSF